MASMLTKRVLKVQPLPVTFLRTLCLRNITQTDDYFKESNIDIVNRGSTAEEIKNVQDLIRGNIIVHDNFVTEIEEENLLREAEPNLNRLKYQFDHWDDAIHGYREVEKSNWERQNLLVFKRMRDAAIKPTEEYLPFIHVLDLSKNGHIKPHIDSVKFCGSTIAGLSLLSSSVMRFKHEKYSNVAVDALLSQRSLYIIRGAARNEFTHEILHDKDSSFKGKVIPRDRRIAVIMRSAPVAEKIL